MRKKVLFIDRDGTILIEPETDFQIDSFEKFCFVPHAISSLFAIAEKNIFEFVMVSNQDGLGTPSYPLKTFQPYQDKMLTILKSEGITFSNIHIDPSFPHENSPNRKPNTGMLSNYFDEKIYDLENSYVIGDRETDILLAEKMGCRSLLINIDENKQKEILTKNSPTAHFLSWRDLKNYLEKQQNRTAYIIRETKETKIKVDVNIDGKGTTDINTGIDFFDHMLEQISKHATIDLKVFADGDLHIDEHHTIEDVGLTLGQAFSKALGDKKGIKRYGFLLPMDDCLAQVALDFSGRPWFIWDVSFRREAIGNVPTEMFSHFFKSFSDTAQCNLNIKAEGENEHHKIEAIFKAFAKSLRMAFEYDERNLNLLPSTKGVL